MIYGSQVTLEHNITQEIIYGKVVGYPEGFDGCTLRRTDQHGNALLLAAIELDDDDYEIKGIDGNALH